LGWTRVADASVACSVAEHEEEKEEEEEEKEEEEEEEEEDALRLLDALYYRILDIIARLLRVP
jgi:ribosomal protein L12E/L44/L45/RPP1/RPP2